MFDLSTRAQTRLYCTEDYRHLSLGLHCKKDSFIHDGIMKPGPTLQCGPGLHYSVDLRIQTLYTEPVPLKYGKLATNIRGYTDIFLQCTSTLILLPSQKIFASRQNDVVSEFAAKIYTLAIGPEINGVQDCMSCTPVAGLNSAKIPPCRQHSTRFRPHLSTVSK